MKEKLIWEQITENFILDICEKEPLMLSIFESSKFEMAGTYVFIWLEIDKYSEFLNLIRRDVIKKDRIINCWKSQRVKNIHGDAVGLQFLPNN